MADWRIVANDPGRDGARLYTVVTSDGRRTRVQVPATVRTIGERDAVIQAAVDAMPPKLPEGT